MTPSSHYAKHTSMTPNAEVVAVTARFPKDLKLQMDEWAAKSYLSLNDWLIQVIMKHMEPKPPQQPIDIRIVMEQPKKSLGDGKKYGP